MDLGQIIIIIGVILGVLLLFLLIILYFIHRIFAKRHDLKADLVYFTARDFEDLTQEEISFDRGKYTLRGYLYSYHNTHNNKMIIFSSGLGPGHLQYTSLIYEFTKRGYLVLAFDNLGCNMSDGRGIGLPYEGTKDYRLALDYVLSQERFKTMSLYGLGHSLGAFSVLSSLNYHSRLVKVAAISPFNSLGQIASKGLIMRFFLNVSLFLGYGIKIFKTAQRGIKKSKIKTLVIYGDLDQTVPRSAMPLKEYKNVTLFKKEGFGHSPYLTLAGQEEVSRLFEHGPEGIDFRKACEIDPKIVKMIDSFFNAF